MKLKVIYIFLAYILWKVILDLEKYVFLWQTCYFRMGVILHLGKYGNYSSKGHTEKTNYIVSIDLPKCSFSSQLFLTLPRNC